MSWLPKQNVIVPVDFSDESFAAVQMARDSFVEQASALHVIYVLPPLVPTEPGVIWQTVDDNSRSRHAIKALQDKLHDAKYQGIQLHVAFGDPGQQIAEYAAKFKADLIIMPSHGRTGLSRILLGSVADRVLRLAHCPVLVLRGKS